MYKITNHYINQVYLAASPEWGSDIINSRECTAGIKNLLFIITPVMVYLSFIEICSAFTVYGALSPPLYICFVRKY